MNRLPGPTTPTTLTLQDLSPSTARTCLKAERFVAEALGVRLAGRDLVVAFSGGADSTALLAWAVCLSRRFDVRVTAAHLDHQLRPESREEARHAKAVADLLGIPFHARAEDVARLAKTSALGIEDAARQARYRFLESVRQMAGADFILTAHHLDDLAEDILMRLIRGAGWPELGGMAGLDPERKILRPLLLTPKAELQALAASAGLPWVEDSSNQDLRYRRNRVRHDLIPLILRENPAFPEAAARLWQLARVDADYWRAQTSATPPQAQGVQDLAQEGVQALDQALYQGQGQSQDQGQDQGVLVLAGPLLKAHEALRLRLLKAGLQALGPGQPLAQGLFSLSRAVREGEIGALVQFPGGRTARVLRQGVVFSRTGPVARRQAKLLARRPAKPPARRLARGGAGRAGGPAGVIDTDQGAG